MKKVLLPLLAVCALLLLASCTHTHAFGEWTVAKAATCTEPGTMEQTCACGEKQTKTIPATGHSFGNWTTTKAATCTEGGTQICTCSNCGETKTEPVPATGHSFSEWTVSKEATCTSNGTKISKCADCAEIKTETIEPIAHVFANWTTTKEATCTESGTKISKCSNCTEVKTEAIAPTGHSFKNWNTTKAATCVSNGTKTSNCSNCNETKSETLLAFGHSWQTATCTEPKTCSTCGTTEGNALGHIFLSGKCTRCGESDGIWSLGTYVDEFQLLTNEKYIIASTSGTFSNTATTNSELRVYVFADKLRIDDPEHIDFYFQLYEYGSQLVKMSYSDKYYDIIMRTPTGEKHTLSAILLSGDDRLRLENVFESLVLKSLSTSGKTSFYISEKNNPSTNYLFSIESSNFTSRIKELDN